MGIDESRERIQQLDRVLVQILEERFEITKGLAQEKNDLGMPVEDKDQEERVLDRIEEISGDPDLRDIFSEIMEVSKKKMRDQL